MAMREKEKSTRVIFVRHGKPDFAHDRLYCDEREDPILTEEGHEQARAAARVLASENVDVVYASPMQRTLMTADPIVRALNVPMHLDARLKERPFGIWDGMYFEDIRRDYPDDFLAWKQNPVTFVPEGGEPITDHQRRIGTAVREIVERHPTELIVIVMHVGPIRMSVTEAMQMPLSAYRQLTVDYGSLTRIDYGKKQDNLIYLNRKPVTDTGDPCLAQI